MKALCLVGRSGVGKTSLLELTLAELRRRGVRVLVVKNSHHKLGDKPGSDSHRLSVAGAAGVILSGQEGQHLFLDQPLSLPELLSLLAPRYEVALIEGGKTGSLPKVELLGMEPPMLSPEDVVGYLQRGAEGPDQAGVGQLLDFLETDGRSII